MSVTVSLNIDKDVSYNDIASNKYIQHPHALGMELPNDTAVGFYYKLEDEDNE